MVGVRLGANRIEKRPDESVRLSTQRIGQVTNLLATGGERIGVHHLKMLRNLRNLLKGYPAGLLSELNEDASRPRWLP